MRDEARGSAREHRLWKSIARNRQGRVHLVNSSTLAPFFQTSNAAAVWASFCFFIILHPCVTFGQPTHVSLISTFSASPPLIQGLSNSSLHCVNSLLAPSDSGRPSPSVPNESHRPIWLHCSSNLLLPPVAAADSAGDVPGHGERVTPHAALPSSPRVFLLGSLYRQGN